MFKKILILALLLVPVTTWAQSPKVVDKQAVRVAFESEKLTVSSTAVSFTSTKILPTTPANRSVAQRQATEAYCTVEADAIRWLATGTAPTATTGLLQAAATNFTIYGAENISNFKMIRVTTDATVNCQYYR